MQIIAEEGDATSSVLLRHDPKLDLFVRLSGYSRHAALRPYPAASGPSGVHSAVCHRVLAQKNPLVLRGGLHRCELDEVGDQFLGASSFASACILPFVGEPNMQGILAVGEERDWIRAPFTPGRIHRLELACMQIGAALSNLQWQEQAQLNQLGLALSASLEINILLKRIYDRVASVQSADLYCIGLWHAESASLNVELLIDEGQQLAPCRVPSKGNLLGQVITSRTSLLLQNSRPDAGLSLPHSPLDWNRFPSWLGVPIQTADAILGVIAVASRGTAIFHASDQERLEKIAEQASIGLANALHHHEIEEQAHRDSLTQVLNHRFFSTRLEQEVRRAQESGQPLSLIIVDIDHFKDYNDQYGHLVGDSILCCVAQSLRRYIKHADLVGRWGGDEFVIALPDSDVEAALCVANRIRKTLAEACLEDHRRRNIPMLTVSQGIATLSQETSTPLTLVDAADQALYQAKRSGGDGVKILERSEPGQHGEDV